MTSYVVTFHHLILLCYHAYIFVLIGLVQASSILFVDNNANETVGQHVVHFSFLFVLRVCCICMMYVFLCCILCVINNNNGKKVGKSGGKSLII